MPKAELEGLPVGATLRLPDPDVEGKVPLERAIARRRSVRSYDPEAELSLEEIGQILWAAQGVTDPRYGFRSAPSAGATFPLETFCALPEGLFQYLPHEHSLRKVLDRDIRRELAAAALGQWFISEAPMTVIFCAAPERTTRRYGSRGVRYVHFEVGHAAQNVHLQAVALELGSVAVGAFDDAEVARVMQLPSELKPLYMVPVGRPKGVRV